MNCRVLYDLLSEAFILRSLFFVIILCKSSYKNVLALNYRLIKW